MSRVSPIPLEEVTDVETRQMIENAERLMGFVPNDALVMARQPGVIKAIWALVAAVYGPGEVDNGLKRLIGEAASKAAGCFYCSAHAAHGAETQGISREKIEAVWNFEDSPLLDEAERAAINLAMKSAYVPNEATDEDFARLRKHFTDNQIIEIVSVIGMFGFLNRWNSTLDTAIEPKPLSAVEGLSG